MIPRMLTHLFLLACEDGTKKKRRLVLAAHLEPKPLAVETQPKEEPVQQDAKAHARQLSGRHLPKKSLHALQRSELSPDGPNTPIPTPPPETWLSKVKEEKDDLCWPPRPSLEDAMRYLPLYTVQLVENADQRAFFVLDFQVGLLLGLSSAAFWTRYPTLKRRRVSDREKERLWSPLASMICTHDASKVAEKKKFADTEMYFVHLEQVVGLIKSDYSHISQNLITITLDMKYNDKQQLQPQQPKEQQHPKDTQAPPQTVSSRASLPPLSPVTRSPAQSLATNTTTTASSPTFMPSPKRPGFGLPPKFALKLKKCGVHFDKKDPAP